MRTLWIGTLGSLVALVGLAGTANATATVDLLWAGSGTSVTTAGASDTLTLNIVMTAGPGAISSFGISIQLGSASSLVTGFTNAPNGVAPFQFTLGMTVANGTLINNFNAAGFGPALGAGLSYLAGRIVFHSDGNAATITPVVIGAPSGTDAINNGSFLDISGTTTFNSATIASVPEPGTAILMGLGLAGIAATGRRRS